MIDLVDLVAKAIANTSCAERSRFYKDDAKRVLATLREAGMLKEWKPTHRHRKTGGEYIVIAESGTEWDMCPVAIYQGEDGKYWVRPKAEFLDIRFDPLPNPSEQGER